MTTENTENKKHKPESQSGDGSAAPTCSPTFFIRGIFIRERFSMMREQLKAEPFEMQESIGSWLDAIEAEIFEECTK